jgi:hypothetical protein
VDAILPDTLRDMVRRTIERHIDKDAVERSQPSRPRKGRISKRIAANLPREFSGASRLRVTAPRKEPIARNENFDSELDGNEKLDDDGAGDADFAKVVHENG